MDIQELIAAMKDYNRGDTDELMDRAAMVLEKLAGAIRDYGLTVMQTTGVWSLHDTSKLGELRDERELEVINRSIDLEVENERLKRRIFMLENSTSSAVLDLQLRLERFRLFVGLQPCECYDEYGQRKLVPCERCILWYGCETWDEFEQLTPSEQDEDHG